MGSTRLSDEMIDQAVEEFSDRINRLWRVYYRGMISEYDIKTKMNEIFYKSFCQPLKACELKISITAKSWQRFLLEYGTCYSTGEIVGNSDEDWIKYEEYPIKETCVSSEDKKQFFQLMRKFDIPTEFFEPVPDYITKPQKKLIHPYSRVMAYYLPFNCIDDGGLLSAEDPLGESYVLINDVGLKAVLKVTEDRRNETFDRGYYAEGYIEGYTAKERNYPKVYVALDENGTITYVDYDEEWTVDLNAFNEHPIWKDYFDWKKKREEKNDEILEGLFRLYDEQGQI